MVVIMSGLVEIVVVMVEIVAAIVLVMVSGVEERSLRLRSICLSMVVRWSREGWRTSGIISDALESRELFQ